VSHTATFTLVRHTHIVAIFSFVLFNLNHGYLLVNLLVVIGVRVVLAALAFIEAASVALAATIIAAVRVSALTQLNFTNQILTSTLFVILSHDSSHEAEHDVEPLVFLLFASTLFLLLLWGLATSLTVAITGLFSITKESY